MRRRTAVFGVLVLVLLANAATAITATAQLETSDPFHSRWNYTDEPVATGQVNRTWMWGPEAFSTALVEEYHDASGGERAVQYFDKARMEINNPDADPSNLWYVTNGLLVMELISGRMQIGDDLFVEHQPAEITVAGDGDSMSTPTYAGLAGLLDEPARAVGEVIASGVARDGAISSMPDMSVHAVTAAYHVAATDHSIASPFWEFMNSTGLVSDGGMMYQGRLFPDPFYATGYPVTEAHWTKTIVGGTERDVLVQAFERRVLTYTPDNPEGWQVEAGNVGRHYHAWRYAGMPADGHEVMFSIPVGPEGLEYRLGSNPPSGALNSGPTALSMAPDGTFWIADTTDVRVVHYAPDGELLNEIDLTQHSATHVFDVEASTSDVWVLFSNQQSDLFQLARFIPEGQLIDTYDLHDDPLVSDYVGYSPGITITDGGEVVLEAAGGEARARVVDAAGQQDNTPVSSLTYSGHTYAWRYDSMTSHVLIVDDTEIVLEGRPGDLAIETGLVDQVSGDTFVAEINYIPDDSNAPFRYTVERISVDGQRLAVAVLPTDDHFVFVQFDLVAGPDGEVYQMVTFADHIDVIRLEFEPL